MQFEVTPPFIVRKMFFFLNPQNMFLFLFHIFIGVELIYSVFFSAVQQSESVTRIRVSTVFLDSSPL